MSNETLESVLECPSSIETERERQRRGILSHRLLLLENYAYTGTGGVSCNNRGAGFAPAYRDTRTGVVVLSRFGDGSPAPVHLLDGVPEEWVASRTPDGQVATVRSGIIAGFVREGRFFTREEAVETLSH